MRNVNTDPLKISSLKEILKTNETQKKKKDLEDCIKRNSQAIPTLAFDENALMVKTPPVPTFDYAALMMK
jgi:hypothetical protein